MTEIEKFNPVYMSTNPKSYIYISSPAPAEPPRYSTGVADTEPVTVYAKSSAGPLQQSTDVQTSMTAVIES